MEKQGNEKIRDLILDSMDRQNLVKYIGDKKEEKRLTNRIDKLTKAYYDGWAIIK